MACCSRHWKGIMFLVLAFFYDIGNVLGGLPIPLFKSWYWLNSFGTPTGLWNLDYETDWTGFIFLAVIRAAMLAKPLLALSAMAIQSSFHASKYSSGTARTKRCIAGLFAVWATHLTMSLVVAGVFFIGYLPNVGHFYDEQHALSSVDEEDAALVGERLSSSQSLPSWIKDLYDLSYLGIAPFAQLACIPIALMGMAITFALWRQHHTWRKFNQELTSYF